MTEPVKLNFAKYDFLDFGAYKGGSIDYARKHFRAGRGLGIDIDPHQVEAMRQAGYESYQGDITRLVIPPKSVRFVMISHILEHLPNLRRVENTLRSAARAASDFLFIQGPFFDGDSYLESLGLKFYWSDWTGHPCHLTVRELRGVLEHLDLRDYTMMGHERIHDSDHPTIHPLISPFNQHAYDPQAHPPKPHVTFDRELYREIVCVVRLRRFWGWRALTKRIRRIKKADILVDSETSEPQVTQAGLPKDYASLAPQMNEIHKRLLIDRGWDFLSYFHLRDALLLTTGVRSVATFSRRRGYCEIALALEFPDINFCLIPPANQPKQRYADIGTLAEKWDLGNVRCAEPGQVPDERFDLVAATEMFDGSAADQKTIELMARLSKHYLWLLTSFDPCGQVPWKGYSCLDIERMLPAVIELRGCFRFGGGLELRRRLEAMSNSEIAYSLTELRERAAGDIAGGRPTEGDCLALWALSSVAYWSST